MWYFIHSNEYLFDFEQIEMNSKFCIHTFDCPDENFRFHYLILQYFHPNNPHCNKYIYLNLIHFFSQFQYFINLPKTSTSFSFIIILREMCSLETFYSTRDAHSIQTCKNARNSWEKRLDRSNIFFFRSLSIAKLPSRCTLMSQQLRVRIMPTIPL